MNPPLQFANILSLPVSDRVAFTNLTPTVSHFQERHPEACGTAGPSRISEAIIALLRRQYTETTPSSLLRYALLDAGVAPRRTTQFAAVSSSEGEGGRLATF